MRSICFCVAVFCATALQTGSECSVPLTSLVNSCDADGCCGLGVTSIAHGLHCQAQCVDGESGNLVQCFNGVLDLDFGCATPSLERTLQSVSSGPSDGSNGTESDDTANVTRAVTGSITFTVDDPAAFANSTEVQTSLQNTMAEYVGVMASQVTVNISVALARRLSQLRRLAGSVVVAYEITGANPDAVTALETAASDPSDLQQNMNDDFVTANIQHVMTGAVMTAVPAEVPPEVDDMSSPRGELPSSSGSSEVFLLIPALVLALVFQLN